ncbi:hypothetical protein HHL21_18085 [Massilia sp. RP-1-19]|uniref:Uncharacterized protein n=1 Tax=Massilia polaris TaxID=2728846 RepID=A0A848HNU0_9BURK|nr:hypothetical protein [Massilia polaris]NML62952.1 hypothetical protein [Massilia polaris]
MPTLGLSAMTAKIDLADRACFTRDLLDDETHGVSSSDFHLSDRNRHIDVAAAQLRVRAVCMGNIDHLLRTFKLSSCPNRTPETRAFL